MECAFIKAIKIIYFNRFSFFLLPNTKSKPFVTLVKQSLFTIRD